MFLSSTLLILVFIWQFLLQTDVFPIYSNENTSLPLLYPDLQDEERCLPQHNLDLPYPEGRSVKMLHFGNQIWGFIDNPTRLLNTYIAYLAQRTYIFTPFTWDLNNWPFVPITSDGHLMGLPYKVRPARVPLTAYINSPTMGSPWPPGDPAP
ncbi:hypothetical protein BS47DRAFT_1415930 [Hydnum rufescens UP504]|uniref:Uncharacterized protein n=1 Tax=Hydnum rufescens UP504 TaxID=1448309 RepID=A0A9P6AME1_9AGAM|nr:hypothetical protein BS47DRAFT_1415930 [Hydnum rufescens UP504]